MRSPEEWLSNWRIVTSRDRSLSKDSRYCAARSSSESRPSSCRISTAVPMTGFVFEAMRKSVSRSIGNRYASCRHPTTSCRTMTPRRATMRTAPFNSSRSTASR